MSIFNRLYYKLLRPVLSRANSYLTYKTYEYVFRKDVEDWRPDIVHGHDGVTLPTAVKAAKAVGAKVVFDSHELEKHRSPPLSRLRKLQVDRVERRYLRECDKVMTVTELAADFLAHEYGIPRPTVLMNAPPMKEAPVPARWDVLDRDDIRSDLMLHPRNFLFIYTGNITLNRGLELAVIALSKLQGYHDPNGRFRSSYHLAAVGKVQSRQDVAIMRLAEKYDVKGKVHIVEPVAPHRVSKYISTANASIIPIMPVTLSYEYAMPNKLFEAMMSGNPIIASDLLEMAPFIADNGLGLTYAADSPQDCVEKMMDLINRFPEFERNPERQRQLEQKYAWEAQEKKLLAMYEEMMG